MKFNKLVRDKIPEIIKKDGVIPVIHIADDKEYILALGNKLQEEAAEFLENPSVEEAADILEVLHAICDFKKVSLQTLEDIRKSKAEERGGFEKRIILDSTEY